MTILQELLHTLGPIDNFRSEGEWRDYHEKVNSLPSEEATAPAPSVEDEDAADVAPDSAASLVR